MFMVRMIRSEPQRLTKGRRLEVVFGSVCHWPDKAFSRKTPAAGFQDREREACGLRAQCSCRGPEAGRAMSSEENSDGRLAVLRAWSRTVQ